MPGTHAPCWGLAWRMRVGLYGTVTPRSATVPWSESQVSPRPYQRVRPPPLFVVGAFEDEHEGTHAEHKSAEEQHEAKETV